MKKIIYAKFQNVYKAKFLLSTQILKDTETGLIEVIKVPLTEESKEHIRNMYEAGDKLPDVWPTMHICKGYMEDERLHFPYIKGKNYLDILVELADGDPNRYIECWTNYLSLLDPSDNEKCAFYETSKFEQVFGDASGFLGQNAYKKCSFDVTPANVLIDSNKRPVLIDYEWFFDVPLPVGLLKYHVVTTSCRYHPVLTEKVSFNEILELCHLEAEQSVYERALSTFFGYICNNELFFSLQSYKKSCKISQEYELQNCIKSMKARIEKMLDWEAQQTEANENAQKYIASLEQRIQKMLDWEAQQESANENAQKCIASLEQRIHQMLDWEAQQAAANENAQQYIGALEHRIHKMLAWEAEQNEMREADRHLIESLEKQIQECSENIMNMSRELQAIKSSYVWRILRYFIKNNQL